MMYEPTAAKPEPTTPSLPGYGGLQQPSRVSKILGEEAIFGENWDSLGKWHSLGEVALFE